MKKILLKNARIIDNVRDEKADLLITGEKISGLDKPGSFAKMEEECQVFDLTGKYLFPGIIDSQTYYSYCWQGKRTENDFYQESIAAAAGGVTTVIDFVDFPDRGDFASSLAVRKELASSSIIDYSFHQIIEDFNSEISARLADLPGLGFSSIKFFAGAKAESENLASQKWQALFRRLKELKLLPTIQAGASNLVETLAEVYQTRNLAKSVLYSELRSVEAEACAIKKIGYEAMKADIPVYLLHLSSGAALRAIRELREQQAEIYSETTPLYLLLDNSYLDKDEFKFELLNPPLREKYDKEKLWQGISENEFQVIATAHCSLDSSFDFSTNLKSAALSKNYNKFRSTIPGLPGSETLLPLIYSLGVRNNRLNLKEMIELLSVNPAKYFGLYPQKGSLKLGTDADLTVFDPEIEKKLTAANLYSNPTYSPYHDFTIKGLPVMTYRRGEMIFSGEIKAEAASGKFIQAGVSSLMKF